ncbi:hypothetical protein M569_13591 [Genlisea aurea]|uniref:Uncharacterized protein n=1 Tax=Genlisea aurea TaxID=192259 RepID=S8DNA6_9LAMI|nr:hypothetical protein M569_13591 [Genlisea aurea]
MASFKFDNNAMYRRVLPYFSSPSTSFYDAFKLSFPSPLFPSVKVKPSSPFHSLDSSSCFSSEAHSSVLMELVKAIEQRGHVSPNSIAIKSDNKCHSYNQLIFSAGQIAALLDNTVKGNQEKNSLEGARVGIVAKPSPEFVAGLLGTWLRGGVAVPLALSYPEAELLHVINDSGITIILSTEDHQELMTDIAAKASSRLSLLPSVPSLNAAEFENGKANGNGVSKENGHFHRISEDEPALIIYTSGTTGKPKGVVHTHKGIVAQAKMLTDAWGYTSDDHFLQCLPLHHILLDSFPVEFIPKFSVRGIWQRWRESYPEDQKSVDAVTVFTGVPTMYTRLIQGYDAMDSELQAVSSAAARKLRLMMCGSSALPLPIMERWKIITGHELLERYGMTEFVMAISNPLNGKRKGGTVGKLLPGVEAKIVAEDGSENPTTAEGGELCIRSPSLFREYWNLPDVTKESFVDGGFFRTGDAARIDEDGYFIILGRTNADIMKVGGYKLSALEIEAVLLEHPSISECCVLGLADKDYGEAVTAVVVPEMKTAPLSLEELCGWAKDKLAPYKMPTRLFVWESLPRNAMGKVNKKELKKMLADK